MVKVAAKINHPHITVDPQVCGGSPIVGGTRFPVRSVVYYVLRLGMTPEELVHKFPHMNLAQVHDALAYYYDNRAEIEQDIAQNEERAVREETR
jgi:uncharacterized protein (DUF433 family)